MKSEKSKGNKVTLKESVVDLSGRYKLKATGDLLNFKHPSEAQYGNKTIYVFQVIATGKLIECEMKDVEKVD